METKREREDEFTQNFSEILSEDGGDRGRDIERITHIIPREVTRENNDMVTKPVAMQEVEEVVNQMALGKSPGLDGFTSIFFHHFWDLVKGRFLRSLKNPKVKGEFSKLSMQPS